MTETQSPSVQPIRTGSIVVELVVLAAFAAAFLLAFDERPGYVDLALALVAVALIGAAHSRTRRIWDSIAPIRAPYGERARRALRDAALFTIPALVVLLAVGAALAAREGGAEAAVARLANPNILLAWLLYAPWAVLQQFVFQFYLLGRLLALLPPGWAIALSSVAFASVHYPRTPIMAVTLLAGAVWAVLYRRHRALLPLAISHALLGAALHYWLFGRDLAARWLGLG